MDNVTLVWKVPKETTTDSPYEEFGVYPSGELMGVCPDEETADRLIDYLREFSPSEEFGNSEDPRQNSMEDAPYIFTISKRELTTFDDG